MGKRRVNRERLDVKVTAEEVRAIREAYAAGSISQAKLAHKYGISRTLIGNIVRGDARRRVEGPCTSRHLTEAAVRAIRLEWALGGVTQKQLAAKYGCKPITIWAVVRGQNWKHVEDHSRQDWIVSWFESSYRRQIPPERRLSHADSARIFSIRGER